MMAARPRLLFHGEWADLLGDVSLASAAVALTREQYGDGTNNSGFLMDFLRHDRDEEMNYKLQANHDVKVPGELRLHVHTIPMSVPTVGSHDIVRWKWYYYLAAPGVELPRNIALWTSNSISQTIATANQYKHTVFSVVTIPIPAGTAASSILYLRFIRPGATDATDTYDIDKAVSGGGLTGAANLAISYIDCHVQRSRAGTKGEFA